LSKHVNHDEEKCELRILGERHVAVDVEALCNHLDTLVGSKVAEVMINQHTFPLGRDDAARIREKNPQATVREVIDSLIEADCASGVGITRIVLPESPSDSVDLEISNPCMKRTFGAAKALLFSYWCGALTYLLGKEYRVSFVAYDESKNLLKCQIAPR